MKHPHSSLLCTPFISGINHFNGWALYAGDLMFPHLTDEEQFFILRRRLSFAAALMLEPQIHHRKITADQALQVLTHEIALPPSLASAQLHPYFFAWPSPGRAPAVYWHYKKILNFKNNQKLSWIKFQRDRSVWRFIARSC